MTDGINQNHEGVKMEEIKLEYTILKVMVASAILGVLDTMNL